MGDSYRPRGGNRTSKPRVRYTDTYSRPVPPPPPASLPYDGYAPPPPPPPPPPGSGYGGYYPPDGRDGRDYRPPPPPPSHHNDSMHRFGGGYDNRSRFNFSGPGDLPAYPGAGNDRNRPMHDDYSARRRQDARDRDGRNRRGGRRGGRQGGRPFKKEHASDRALLRFSRGETPPQLEGMNGGDGGAKYLDFDELSDVEDQDMEESEDEDKDSEEEESEPPTPKPKWSNAELYTALPPPDESQRQRKDMVKLIRKARIQPTKDSEEAVKPVASVGDDFISLEMGDDDEEEEEELIKPGVPNAPTGPAAGRSFQNLDSKPQVTARPAIDRQAAETADSVASRLSSLKRKRPVEEDTDDELLRGYIRPPSKSLKRGPMPSGSLAPEWQLVSVPPAIRDKKAIPWQNTSTRSFRLPNVRLHYELVDFYHFVQPKNYEKAVRLDLLNRLETFMKRIEPTMDCQVKCFGSFALGVYLPDADMDVTILSRQFREREVKVLCQSSNKMYRLANRMRSEGLAEDFEVIPRARVPIIKIIDKQTNLKVDISFENPSGLRAVETFEKWKAQFPAMPILTTVIKQFLLMRGLNDVAVGGLGGFAVTCLVTSLLQHLPRVQLGEVKPEQHLGEMLIEFLDYYGHRFDRENTAIRMDPPALLTKILILRSGNIPKAKPERLMIIDPNNQSNDISGGTSQVDSIFHKFRQAKTEILKAIDTSRTRQRSSFLDWMLGGNYDSFLWYRRRLKEVYERKWGQVPPEDMTLA